MVIRFRCEKCGQVVKTDESRVGHSFRCPKCKHKGTVPRPDGAPAGGPAGAKPVDDEPEEEEVERVGFQFKHAEDDGIDMTPMVDIVFQLLIFFMVTAAFSMQKSLEIPPPDQEQSAAQARTIEELETDDDYVIIRIERDNTVWVNDSEAPSQQEVLVKLREAREGTPGSGSRGPTSLLVLADGDARHETVVMALDAGNAVGMENVRLATVDEDAL